ncbi:MAG: hypothetical protein ABIK07_14235 [Planctomycetota bacterium]
MDNQERAEIEAEIFGGEVVAQPEAMAEAVVAQPEAQPVDPWEGVSPIVREQFEQLNQKVMSVDSLTMRLKTAEGRVGALQSELAKRNAPPKAEEKKAPTEEQIAAAEASDAAWEMMKEDFPEWAEAFESRFAAARAEFEPKVEGLRREVVDRQAERDAKLEHRLVAFKYPNFQAEYLEKKEFWDWLGTQPADVQQLSQSAIAEDAIAVLDAYTTSKTSPQANRRSRLAAERKDRLAKSEVVVRGTPQQPIKSEADMSVAELRQKVAREIWSK